jgi:EmrB/QacA subfamily drug resistance transporter
MLHTNRMYESGSSARSESAPSSRLGLILLVVSGAAFLDFLDVTAVNLAFSEMQADFGQADVTDLAWVITGYSVLFAALLAPGGRLADVLGRRKVFVFGATLFTVASLASALAPTLAVLVVARFVQGAAAALTLPAGLGIVLAESPPDRRAAAIGIWGASTAVAAIIGPTVGGLLVDTAGWRSIFLINIPIGALIVFGTLRLVRPSRRAGGPLPDLAGTLLVGVGVGLVVLGVTQGEEWGWDEPATIGSLAAGAIALVAGLLRSRGHPAPAIETVLWRSRKFATSNAASLLFGAAMYAWMLVCALWLIGVWGYSEIEAGLAMSPGAVSGAVGAGVVGRRIEVGGQRASIFLGGLLWAAVGLWLVLRLGTDPNFLGIWLPAGLVGGAAMGAIGVGIATAGVTAVEPARYAAATGLNMTARQVGGALGVAVLAVILRGVVPGDIDPYLAVFLFCSLGAATAGLLGLWVRDRAQALATASSTRRTSVEAARNAAR